jgi:4-hydroxyphenylacetate decarboxylase large subunit
MAIDTKKEKRLQEILEEQGQSMGYVYGGEKGPKDVVMEREIKLQSTPRVKELMQKFYFQAYSSANVEFPYWYTRAFAEADGDVIEVRRAKALACAYAHTTPSIYPGDLLPGGKASYIRGGFPMPWITNSFYLANEGEWLDSVAKGGNAASDRAAILATGGGNVVKDEGKVISLAGKFGIRAEEVPVLTKLAREWAGKSVEDLGLKYEQMMDDGEIKKNIMKAGLFSADSGYTIPQGREVASYYYPLQYGIDGMIDFCEKQKKVVAGNADGDGIIGMKRLYFYEAASIVLKGIQQFWLNYVKELRDLAAEEQDEKQKAEYEALADRMEWISHNSPRDFREALHLTYLIHITVLNEDAISGYSPGRLGLVLYPYFEKDIGEGKITEAEVIELLENHRFKFSCIELFASSGISGGIGGNTFNNLCVGGLDRKGRPCGNRLEWLIVHAGMTNQCPQPTLSVLYDERLPEEFLLKCVECTKTGAGYPAWISNRTAMEFLLNQFGEEGMTVEEARAIAIGGCLETQCCSWMPLEFDGKVYYIPAGSSQVSAVGIHFMNLPGLLNVTLFNGKEPMNGIRIFPPHNKELSTYEELWEQFKAYVEKAMEVGVRSMNIQHDIWRQHNMSLVNSLFKPDCLIKGHHIGHMGTRYNGTYNIETVGTANLINSLAALKKLVYEDKKYTLDDFRDAIINNFGFYTARETGSFSLGTQVKKPDVTKYDNIHGDCLKAPKHGNADKYTDDILAEYEEWFCPACNKYFSLYAKKMYACQISVAVHATVGSRSAATPDGRLCQTAYADGSMSAYPGTDRNGPYAVFASALCWDQSKSQNSQINMKLHPNAVRGLDGSKKLLKFICSYMKQGGFHVQFNVVDSEMLKQAQERPENYRDLLVRVSGFTQYWVETAKPVQDEVIARTEYMGGI